ncbi:GOLPH3/VPS74 family protein [Roseococcus sp. YIM B11640]|uniref:GOLPH3/VPS74 family protein n=1 Tax=Roseococcus sp. YIM B11640 TaxID=3133973 RepID=UPI003C7DFA0A
MSGERAALSLPEEIVLLTLDEAGKPIGRLGLAADFALAGAVLMELSLAGRIDTDLARLHLVNDEPLGDPVLDAGLRLVASQRDSRGAIMALAREESGLRGTVLDRLVARGLLRRQEGRMLLVFPTRRFLKPEDRAEPREVQARLLRLIQGDELPEPREALLLGLARASALLVPLFSAPLLVARQERILFLSRLEALNRSVSELVHDLYSAQLRSA